MSKFDNLTAAISQIDTDDWQHVGQKMQKMLDSGDLDSLRTYVQGISDVVFIKGCPRKVALALQQISQIL